MILLQSIGSPIVDTNVPLIEVNNPGYAEVRMPEVTIAISLDGFLSAKFDIV